MIAARARLLHQRLKSPGVCRAQLSGTTEGRGGVLLSSEVVSADLPELELLLRRLEGRARQRDLLREHLAQLLVAPGRGVAAGQLRKRPRGRAVEIPRLAKARDGPAGVVEFVPQQQTGAQDERHRSLHVGGQIRLELQRLEQIAGRVGPRRGAPQREDRPHVTGG